jgi:spermidine/putrescine transport system permease protein
MNKTGRFPRIWFLCIAAFFYLPLVLLVIYSFNDARTLKWTGFSLKWYKALFFESGTLWHSFYNSIIIATCSAALATFIGTLGAIGISFTGLNSKVWFRLFHFCRLFCPKLLSGYHCFCSLPEFISNSDFLQYFWLTRPLIFHFHCLL